jgi:hypothetical protein
VAGLSELDDEQLLNEYRWSIECLDNLDPESPQAMRDIRARYRDYIGQELAARGLLTSKFA